MDKELLKDTEIGDNISVSSNMGEELIELTITTYEVSTAYFFSYEEWEAFVKCVNITNRGYKETEKNI